MYSRILLVHTKLLSNLKMHIKNSDSVVIKKNNNNKIKKNNYEWHIGFRLVVIGHTRFLCGHYQNQENPNVYYNVRINSDFFI